MIFARHTKAPPVCEVEVSAQWVHGQIKFERLFGNEHSAREAGSHSRVCIEFPENPTPGVEDITMTRGRKFRSTRRTPESERSYFEQKLTGRYSRTLDRNDLLNLIRGGEDTYLEFKIRLVNMKRVTSCFLLAHHLPKFSVSKNSAFTMNFFIPAAGRAFRMPNLPKKNSFM